MSIKRQPTTPRPALAAHEGPTLLYMTKQLELAIRSRLDDMLKRDGITALQYTALTVLAAHGQMPAAQLARHSFVRPQSIADMVKALEGRGLVSRDRNPHNKRELLITLTTAGRELLNRHASSVANIERRMVQGMSPETIRQFAENLRSARHNLDDPQYLG